MTLFDFKKINQENVYVKLNKASKKQAKEFLDYWALQYESFNYSLDQYFKEYNTDIMCFNIKEHYVSAYEHIKNRADKIIYELEEVTLNEEGTKLELERLAANKAKLMKKLPKLFKQIKESATNGIDHYPYYDKLHSHLCDIEKLNVLLGFDTPDSKKVYEETCRRV